MKHSKTWVFVDTNWASENRKKSGEMKKKKKKSNTKTHWSIERGFFYVANSYAIETKALITSRQGVTDRGYDRNALKIRQEERNLYEYERKAKTHRKCE